MNAKHDKSRSKQYKSKSVLAAAAMLIMLTMLMTSLITGCSQAASNKISAASQQTPAADTGLAAEQKAGDEENVPKAAVKPFQSVETIPLEQLVPNYIDCPSIDLPDIGVSAPSIASLLKAGNDSKDSRNIKDVPKEVIYLTRDYMKKIKFKNNYVLAADVQLECTRTLSSAGSASSNNTNTASTNAGIAETSGKFNENFECSMFLIKEHIPGKPASKIIYKKVAKFEIRPYSEFMERDSLSGSLVKKVKVKLMRARCEDTKQLAW